MDYSKRDYLDDNRKYAHYFLSGYCFQFNSDGGMKAKSPGKSGGMQFILDVQAKEYTTGPYSLSEGFAVS